MARKPKTSIPAGITASQRLTEEQITEALGRDLYDGAVIDQYRPIGIVRERVDTYQGSKRRWYSMDDVSTFVAIARASQPRHGHGGNAARWAEAADNAYSEWQWVGLKGPSTIDQVAGDVLRADPAAATAVSERVSQLIVPTPRSVRRRGAWSDRGHEVDLDRVRAGQLDTAWRTTKRLRTIAPARVRVVARINVLANVSFERMAWRGAAAVALCDALTAEGYDVELTALRCATGFAGRETHRLGVRVKAFGESYSTDMARATVSNTAMPRVLAFAAGANIHAGSVSWGFGSSTEGLEAHEFADYACQVVALADGEIDNQEIAQAWINARMAEINAAMIGEPLEDAA